MSEYENLADLDANLARRGIFDACQLRTDIEQFFNALPVRQHYHVQNSADHIQYLIKAEALASLASWLAKYPRLTCHAMFLPPRKPKVADKTLRCVQLAEKDVLSLTWLKIFEADVSLHVYDRIGAGEYRARLATQAPLQTVTFENTDLLSELDAVFDGLKLRYYRLEDGGGHIHYLAQSAALLPLISWMADHSRLVCQAIFAAPRKPKPSDKALRLGQLSDADVLQLARLQLPRLRPQDAPISLHFYDRTGPGEHTARLASQAPMRTINFDAMTASFKGYRIGKPTSMISKAPFELTRIAEDPRIELGPIDVVYTWVDSSDPNWQRRFSDHIGRHTKTTHGSELRYLSRDELRYSIRSVLKYAPWVRNIYIVTDSQRPDWFVGNDRVKIVDHSEIFPDPSVLPVFNSHAIESCLHRIPGLSERFIYFNDDMFLGRPCSEMDFFTPGGRVKTYLSGHLSFNKEWIAAGTLPTDAAFRTTTRIIEKRFGATPIAKAKHVPYPMLKSVLQMIEAEHPEGLARTRAARLRSETDMNVTGNLAYYYCLCLDRGTWPDQGSRDYCYIDTGRQAHMKTLHRLVSAPVKFFCLNLTHHEEVSFKRQALLLRLLFLRLFPRRGSHERHPIGTMLRRFWARPAQGGKGTA